MTGGRLQPHHYGQFLLMPRPQNGKGNRYAIGLTLAHRHTLAGVTPPSVCMLIATIVHVAERALVAADVTLAAVW